MMTVIDLRASVNEWREERRGLWGCEDDEWLAGYLGDTSCGQPLHGTFRTPHGGEPMIVRFADDKGKASDFMAVQRIMPNIYMNCVCGTTFEWSDDLVVVYSAVSRVGQAWHKHVA